MRSSTTECQHFPKTGLSSYPAPSSTAGKGLPAPNRDNLPAKEFSRGLVSHECQIQWHDSDMPRKALHRGLKTATWTFRFAAPAYNLVRMRKLLRLEPHELRYYELTPASLIGIGSSGCPLTPDNRRAHGSVHGGSRRCAVTR